MNNPETEEKVLEISRVLTTISRIYSMVDTFVNHLKPPWIVSGQTIKDKKIIINISLGNRQKFIVTFEEDNS